MLEASLNDQLAGGHGLGKHITCMANGMSRITTFIRPVEFSVLPNVTYIHYENVMPLRIYPDGRNWPTDQEPMFVGYSMLMPARKNQAPPDLRYFRADPDVTRFVGCSSATPLF